MGRRIELMILVVLLVCGFCLGLQIGEDVSCFMGNCLKTQNYLSSPYQANPYNLEHESTLKISSNLNSS